MHDVQNTDELTDREDQRRFKKKHTQQNTYIYICSLHWSAGFQQTAPSACVYVFMCDFIVSQLTATIFHCFRALFAFSRVILIYCSA